MNDSHRKAEALAAAAALASGAGDKLRAFDLYSKAATLEREALAQIPESSVRTRSVLAVSLVSMLYKAREYDDAELEVFRFLSSRLMSSWADTQLRELLEALTDERAIQRKLGRQYSGQAVTVALRGGDIGAGTGPLDLILEKAGAFRSLLYRVAEYVGRFPLRVRGTPPKDLIDLLQMRATEPSAGSYRLEIRLTEPAQLELFAPGAGGPERVAPQAVSDTMFDLLAAVNSGAAERIERLVPDADYRRALLELVKSAAPSGKRIEEIALYRIKGDQTESVLLTPAVPDRVKNVLPRRPVEPGEPQELQGVLRALHLDENWLDLALSTGSHEKCDTVPDMLDDVVGPMVNHAVVVRGVRRTKQGGTRRLLVQDIELVEPS